MNRSIAGQVLTRHQLTFLAAQLEQQRRFRLEQIQAHEISTAHHPATVTATDREIADLLLGGAREALAEIEAARTRLATGSFGHCIDCGTQVAIERLEVLPYVARCTACHRAVAP
jgi:DnaK suppressor protein